MKNLPDRLVKPVSCEIRGEVVMLHSDFNAYNDAHPDKPLANPRNAATGTLRAKDRAKVAGRPLTFMPFDLLEEGVLLRCPDQLTERFLHALREHSLITGRLSDRYVALHGGSSFDLCRIATNAPNRSGRGREGPPSHQVLRATGQPHKKSSDRGDIPTASRR